MYILGIDLGTSSLKGLVMDRNGTIQGAASEDYPLLQPEAGFSEQDPKDWIQACGQVIEELAEKVPDFTQKIEGISFSGQMHSLVVLDEANQPLRNAILWNDVRTTKECEEIMENFGDRLLEITNNRALEGFTLPKMLWLQENEPELWANVRHVLLPKDYLGFWLTGNQQMDYSDAAGTLLLDMERKTWSEELLQTFHISPKILPPLVSSTTCIGSVRKELAEQFGFHKEVKVFAGGADNACAALGAGIIQDGAAMVSIGTSGVFLSYEKNNQKSYEGKLHLFHHAINDAYYSMGVTLAAGHSLNWFKKTFAKGLSFDELLQGIEKIEPGSNGLLFTPYLSGERTPYADSQIRGSFIGMDTRHTLSHFTRAVLEGITFSLKDSQQLMEELAGRRFTRIVSVGGGAKNLAWLQIQADIFDATIYCLSVEEGPALGATMIAALGLGWFDTPESCCQYFIQYTDAVEPLLQNVEKYRKIYQQYRKIYPATKEICHNL